jgi:hypothetical protein
MTAEKITKAIQERRRYIEKFHLYPGSQANDANFESYQEEYRKLTLAYLALIQEKKLGAAKWALKKIRRQQNREFNKVDQVLYHKGKL